MSDKATISRNETATTGGAKAPISKFEMAAQQERPGLVKECLDFLAQNKKWWLLPIVTVFFLFGILMLAGGTAAAPFIYTLF